MKQIALILALCFVCLAAEAKTYQVVVDDDLAELAEEQLGNQSVESLCAAVIVNEADKKIGQILLQEAGKKTRAELVAEVKRIRAK